MSKCEGSPDIASHVSTNSYGFLLGNDPPTQLSGKSRNELLPSHVSSSHIQQKTAEDSSSRINARDMTINETDGSSCSATGGTLEVTEPIFERNTYSMVSPGGVLNCLYKTDFCRQWKESGSCRFGEKCQFAHGIEDLRIMQLHPKYKTEICRNFTNDGICYYGARCFFIHPKFSLGMGQGVSGHKNARRLPIFEQICPSSADDHVG